MENYSRNVLFVGPHNALRGGIASVLDVYSKSFVDFNFLPTYSNKKSGLREIYFIQSIFKLIYILSTKRHIKIVHIHTSSGGSFMRKSLVALLSKLFRKKVILHVHAGGFKIFMDKSSPLLRRYIRCILNLADQVIVLSKEWKDYFDTVLKNRNSLIVNNPVKVPKTVSSNLIKLPLPILYMNHITTAKGIFDIIETFKQNSVVLKDAFKLIVAGAGSETERLKTIINENNNIDGLVEFKGWVAGKEKDDLIKDCNIFILTSYYEGLPISILESMALGKAIIASNVGGIPSVVRPGENGWLLKPGDLEALAGILIEIKNNPVIVEEYGNRSFEISLDYSPEKVLQTLYSIYSNLLTIKHG